jgi:hypothetical protein
MNVGAAMPTPLFVGRLGPAAKTGLACLALLSCQASADGGDFFDFKAHGLADFRYLHVDSSQPSWMDRELGKFRYGAGDGSDLLRVNEAAVVMQSRFGWDWSGSVTVKYADRQINPVDISEAFLQYRPVSTSPWRFSSRLGAFIPPISLENSGTAWSSPYTLSSSVINSWVGEELKTVGGEAQLNYHFEDGDRIGVFGAGFAANDTAGTLLAWRGWSMHDYEATLNDKLPLYLRDGQLHQLFPRQADYTRPFVEVDGRPGYYAGLSLERPERFKFRGMYYDNQARPDVVVDGQYGWHTRFYSLGFTMDLPWNTVLIGQGLAGQTQMGGLQNGRYPVDVGFWAESVLLSKTVARHRFSVRHDRFGTSEHDLLPQDANRESGYAWTINYNFTLREHHQFNAEVSQIHRNRPARDSQGEEGNTQEETLWQLAYRFFF